MRRADRLFLLIQALRGRRVVTARRLAEQLEVSERTIYRDVQDLQLSGVPIEGEAGVGYCLRRGADIPPLMFTAEELEALIVGARLVESWTGDNLSRSARQALLKIEGVLPDTLRDTVDRSRIFAPTSFHHQPLTGHMDAMHRAIGQHLKVRMRYQREDGEISQRSIQPLCLAFFAPHWLLGGWCEFRKDFRSFRLDRIREFTVTDEHFTETETINLNSYLQHAEHLPAKPC